MHNHNILSEEDIKKLFLDKEKPKAKPDNKAFVLFKDIAEWLILLLIIFAIGFTIINWPSIFLKLKYLYTVNLEKQTFSTQSVSSPAFSPDESNIPNPEQKIQKVAYLPNNRLYIDKINVDAPIIWEVPEDQIIQELKNGVVQYQGTGLPDQTEGNIFITGHSSGYWWSKDLYNQVFALLDNLNNGDKISLTYKNKKYTYQVFEKIVVNPNQLEVLASPGKEQILSLMSCVPVGTSLRRLIIKAKPILTEEIDQPKIEQKPASPNEPAQTNSSDEGPINVKPEAPKKEATPDLINLPPPLLFLPNVP